VCIERSVAAFADPSLQSCVPYRIRDHYDNYGNSNLEHYLDSPAYDQHTASNYYNGRAEPVHELRILNQHYHRDRRAW
jgi:hypothetical protein